VSSELQLCVSLIFQEVPRHWVELVKADDLAMVGVDRATVTTDGEPRDVSEVFAALEGLNDLKESDLALSNTDSVGDVRIEVHLGCDAGEPAAPDDRQVGIAFTDGLSDDEAVVDLVAEDA
jgi:hypothetical protein